MPVAYRKRGDGLYYVRFWRKENHSRSAYVIGSFNAHSRGSVELRWTGRGFAANLVLPPGTYEYYYEIDGEKLLDPRAKADHNVLFLRPYSTLNGHYPRLKSGPSRVARFKAIYEIFVDRFVCKEDAPSGTRDKKGAGLREMARRLGYIREMGFDAVYLTPVFPSPSYHRYDALDFFSIDRDLGGLEAYRDFLRRAHSLRLSVIMDMPIHHTSSLASPFEMAKSDPRYRSWYYMDNGGYDTFAQVRGMPKLNYTGAIEWIKDAFRYWSLIGVDAFRVDVASGIPPWALWELKRYVGKPIIGEVWEEPFQWREAVNGIMNYQLWDQLTKFLRGEASGDELAEVMKRQTSLFPMDFLANSWLFLGTHDTARAFTALGSEKKVKAGLTFLYTWIGTPMNYYGDESLTQGGSDPDNRKCMDWQAQPSLKAFFSEWNSRPRSSAPKRVQGLKDQLDFVTDAYRVTLHASGDCQVNALRGREVERDRGMVKMRSSIRAYACPVPHASASPASRSVDLKNRRLASTLRQKAQN